MQVMANGYPITKVPKELYGALFKLKDYEDTGLEPEQLEQIVEKQTQAAVTITGYNHAIGVRIGTCPECEEILRETMKYCPECGQKLEW